MLILQTKSQSYSLLHDIVSLDNVIARHTRHECRRPSLVLSIDAGTGYTSRTSTISYDRDGKPIPAENNPHQIFESLFKQTRGSLKAQRQELNARFAGYISNPEAGDTWENVRNRISNS